LPPKIDMVGKRIGRLKIISEAEYRGKKGKDIYYICECDCGKKKQILGTSLRRKEGGVRSCGCLKIEYVKTHGMTGTRIYKIWDAMKYRCLNENCKSYPGYGGRGITVCEEWLEDFMNFYNWAMDNGYSDDLTIDRIDNNGNYTPNNCRWATNEIQQNNLSSNVLIEFNGITKTMSEWAKQYDIDYQTFVKRVDAGWDIERVLTEPVKSREINRLICIDAESHTYKEWSLITGINTNTLRGRWMKGLRGQDLISDIREEMKRR
jgi:hypothetical protein